MVILVLVLNKCWNFNKVWVDAKRLVVRHRKLEHEPVRFFGRKWEPLLEDAKMAISLEVSI